MTQEKILVVENNSRWRERIFGEELRSAGYEVVTAERYAEALDVFKPHHFALAIIDVVLGEDVERDSQGMKLLEKFHNEDPELPTLAVSVHWHYHPAWIREALRVHGARDALEKQGFDLANFRALVKQYVRSTDPMNEYFLGHRLTSAPMEDLRRWVTEALGELGLRAHAVDQTVESDFLLNTVKVMIKRSRFSVFDLTEARANLFIEIGIAMGYNRPVLLLFRSETTLLDILSSFLSTSYSSGADLKRQLLSPAMKQWIEGAAVWQPHDQRCWSTGRACAQTVTPQPKNYLLCDGGGKQATFFREAVVAALEPRGYVAVFSETAVDSDFLVCQRCRLVRATAFGVHRVSSDTSDEDYVVLGLAIGLGVPFVLVAETRDADAVRLGRTNALRVRIL